MKSTRGLTGRACWPNRVASPLKSVVIVINFTIKRFEINRRSTLQCNCIKKLLQAAVASTRFEARNEEKDFEMISL
jgi:hypothetical protein